MLIVVVCCFASFRVVSRFVVFFFASRRFLEFVLLCCLVVVFCVFVMCVMLWYDIFIVGVDMWSDYDDIDDECCVVDFVCDVGGLIIDDCVMFVFVNIVLEEDLRVKCVCVSDCSSGEDVCEGVEGEKMM